MPLTPKGYCDLQYCLIRNCFFSWRAEMPLTPKGYCDQFGRGFGVVGQTLAEMPLTPKGYCDYIRLSNTLFFCAVWAEMPLTPKGYCDLPELVTYFPGSTRRAEMPLTPKGYCDWLYISPLLHDGPGRQKCP